ncbi:MAG: LPS export ABC transporter ATP-binding protein [Candidatus Coatesbacteria bacterium]|nr:LPS export ABC transporter ATP-binding protein [Candidatus Coatesbacteria bacterium]
MDSRDRLRCVDLVKRYHGRTVVNRVSLEVERGEIVGLLGPNGAGKTTTFYMLVGLVKPDEGTVLLGDEDMSGLPVYARARRGVGYLPQEASIFKRLSVRDNIRIILEGRRLSKKDVEERIDELLTLLDITHIASSMGYTLSGGERRRVEIVRALALSPSFMLLDEPFAGIDPIAIIDLQNIVRKLRSLKIGVLITDHNVRETLKITDRGFIIDEGKIIKSGDPSAIANDELVRKIYLGHDFDL